MGQAFNQTEDLDKELDLFEKGLRTLRFDNQDVLTNLDGVINENHLCRRCGGIVVSDEQGKQF